MIENKQRLLDWCRMRIDGCTFEEIAQQYGVSKQHVQHSVMQILSDSKSLQFYSKIIFPTIREYMAENHLNLSKFSKICDVNQGVISRVLTGKGSPRLQTIDKMILATGIPYEELFRKEDEHEENFVQNP